MDVSAKRVNFACEVALQTKSYIPYTCSMSIDLRRLPQIERNAKGFQVTQQIAGLNSKHLSCGLQ